MRRNRRRNKWKAVAVGAAGILLLLAAAYFGTAYYFSDRFFPRASINGWQVGGMSLAEAEEKVGNGVEDYLLTVFDRDGGKHHVYGGDIGCQYVPDGSVGKLLKSQNPLEWPAALFRPERYEAPLPMSYQEDKISDAVAAMDCFQEGNIIEPEDARIKLGEDGYYIEPEKQGNRMVFARVLKKVRQAVSEGKESVSLTDDDYLQPEVVSDSPRITEAMARIDACQNASITYEIKGYDEVLDTDRILRFLQLGDDYSLTFKDDEIEKYVQELASKYNTYADVRSFKTSAGDTIEIGGGDYGWIIDKPGEAAQIKKDLESGKPVSREPVYAQRPFAEGKDDIGDTYIEIDYTNQHLWYYEKGELVTETDVVTGNISRGNGSPDGVFKIVYKQSPAVLKGEDYESDVTYFMPFAYNVGIHDASWRNGQFGGEIYKHSGSHGCVNAPLDVAEALYEKVAVGTPVVAYYREKVELTAENAKISNAFSYVDPEKKEDAQ